MSSRPPPTHPPTTTTHTHTHTHARTHACAARTQVGKYTDLSDAYLSVTKALQHACMAANRKLKLEWVEASNLEESTRGEDAAAYEGGQGLIIRSPLAPPHPPRTHTTHTHMHQLFCRWRLRKPTLCRGCRRVG